MTICIAAIRDGKGSMTTDSFGSSGEAGRTCGQKFLNIEQEGFLISFSGLYYVSQLAEDVILETNPFGGKVDYWVIKKLAWAIMEKCIERGLETQDGFPDMETDFMIATIDMIYVIQSDGSTFEHEDYGAVGLCDEGNLAVSGLYGDKRMKLSTITETAAAEVCKFYRASCAPPLYTRTL